MASRSDLYDAMNRSFNETELQELCFRMGIDYDNLEGRAKGAKMLALIGYHERRGQIPALIDALVEARPLDSIFLELQNPSSPKPARVAAADALRQLLAEGGFLNKAQTDALKDALRTLKNAAGKGRPIDPQTARRVTELVAAARLSPADRQQAERLLRQMGIIPG